MGQNLQAHAAAFAFVITSTAAHAVIVYDYPVTSPNIQALTFAHDPIESSSTSEDPRGGENTSEIAQLISLAGTDRYVTNVQLWLGRFPGATGRSAVLDATLRIYTVVGDLNTGLPGNLLYEGTVANIALAPNASVPVTFQPNVTVPTNIFLAISNPRVQIDQPLMQPEVITGFRSGMSGRPRIGNAVPVWRHHLTATGAWIRDPFIGGGTFYLNATVNAVPSCATLLPILMLAAARRRRA